MKLELKKLLHIALLLLIIASCSKDDDRINNGPPVIEAQMFTASESVTDTEIIGTLKAEDPNGDALTFKISVDRDDLFEVTEEGALSLIEGKSLDFETSKEHKFTVGVTDGKGIYLTVITVKVVDDGNQVPIIEPQTFEVREDIVDTYIFAEVQAEDLDSGDLTFSITTNSNDLFEISENGELSLADGQNLDADTLEQHIVTVRVEDNRGDGREAQMTINITDIFEGTEEDDDWFVTTWDVNVNDEQTTTILVDSRYTYDFVVDWGDGTKEQITGDFTPQDELQYGPGAASFRHIYELEGTYTVAIKGDFPYFSGSLDETDLLTLEQWGGIAWQSLTRSFRDCDAMVYNATDVPDLTQVEDMSNMFSGARTFNADLSGWDTANVTNMSLMFQNALDFNGDISTWNTTSVTNMSFMFNNADSFNGDISGWNTSRVTGMRSMFFRAESFNGSISGWNTENVTDITAMFSSAFSFDQDLGGWDIGNVDNMELMFNNSGMSIDSMNTTLIGWADFVQQNGGPINITVGMQGITACGPEVDVAGMFLANDNGWQFPGLNYFFNCP